jgi:hypothetical protein
MGEIRYIEGINKCKNNLGDYINIDLSGDHKALERWKLAFYLSVTARPTSPCLLTGAI